LIVLAERTAHDVCPLVAVETRVANGRSEPCVINLQHTKISKIIISPHSFFRTHLKQGIRSLGWVQSTFASNAPKSALSHPLKQTTKRTSLTYSH